MVGFRSTWLPTVLKRRPLVTSRGAQATKGTSPVEAPAATVAAPAEQPAAPAQPGVGNTAVAVDDRPELESLSFPKDGLSRQWLEFLSQLGATK